MKKNCYLGLYVFMLLVFLAGVCGGPVLHAAEPNGEYLQYQEPKASTYSSGLSTVAYIFSLLITFAVVIGLAYFASRFVGEKMGQQLGNSRHRIIATVSLGTRRDIHIVEIAGKYLILGVTDHTISVLQEIIDPAEIEKLKAEHSTGPHLQFGQVFQKQLAALQRLSPKFPNVFNTYHQDEEKHDNEKR